MDREYEMPTSLKMAWASASLTHFTALVWASTRGPGVPQRGSPSKQPRRPNGPTPCKGPWAPSPHASPTPPGHKTHRDPRTPLTDKSTGAVIELAGRILSVSDLIARIDAGGRRDVLVTVTGDTRTGAWEEIREALVFAGI